MFMRSCASAIGAAAVLCAASSASALQADTQPNANPPAAAQTATTPPAALKHLPAGSVVVIEITEAVSSNGRKQGDTFSLRLAEPVVADGAVLLPAGLTGAGEVIDAQGGGFGGAAGKLVLAARYLTYEDRKIPLKAFKFAVAGKSYVGASMAVSLASPIAGFIIHGGEMEVQPGTRATAKIAEDLDLPSLGAAPSAAQPAPAAAAAASPAPSAALTAGSTPTNQETHQ